MLYMLWEERNMLKKLEGWMWESKQMTWNGKHFESAETFHRPTSLLLSLAVKWCRGKSRKQSEKSSTVQTMQLAHVWTCLGHSPS